MDLRLCRIHLSCSNTSFDDCVFSTLVPGRNDSMCLQCVCLNVHVRVSHSVRFFSLEFDMRFLLHLQVVRVKCRLDVHVI